MIAGHCARSDSSQFLLPFQGSVLQNRDHVAWEYAHSVLHWSLAHNCCENQNNFIILLAMQVQCAELLKWPMYLAFGPMSWFCAVVSVRPHTDQMAWVRPCGPGGPQMYSILTFFVDSFELNSVLLAEGSVLGVLGVTSLVIIGGPWLLCHGGRGRGSHISVPVVLWSAFLFCTEVLNYTPETCFPESFFIFSLSLCDLLGSYLKIGHIFPQHSLCFIVHNTRTKICSWHSLVITFCFTGMCRIGIQQWWH